jgi:hypothetical protein
MIIPLYDISIGCMWSSLGHPDQADGHLHFRLLAILPRDQRR